MKSWAWAGKPPSTRSRRPTASWPCSSTRTRTRGTRRPRRQFKEAAEAYAILSDADKRRSYDQFGHAGVGNNGGGGGFQFDPSQFADFQDIFGGIFGGGIFGDLFGGAAPARGRRRAGLRPAVHPAHQLPGGPVRGRGQGDGDPPHGSLRRLPGHRLRPGHQPPGLPPVPGQRPGGGAPGLPADVRALPALRRPGPVSSPAPAAPAGAEAGMHKRTQGALPHPGRGRPGPAPAPPGRRRGRGGRRRHGRPVSWSSTWRTTRVTERDGFDLHRKLEVPWALLVLGGELPVEDPVRRRQPQDRRRRPGRQDREDPQRRRAQAAGQPGEATSTCTCGWPCPPGSPPGRPTGRQLLDEEVAAGEVAEPEEGFLAKVFGGGKGRRKRSAR